MARETALVFGASSHSRMLRSMRGEMTMASTECCVCQVLRCGLRIGPCSPINTPNGIY